MATATSPLTPQAPDLPPDTFHTYAEAVAYGRQMARLAGGGLPVITHAPDGTVVVEAIVRNLSPASQQSPAKVDVPLYVQLDEKGRVIPDTPEVRQERLRRIREATASIEAEPATPEQVEAELEELREIDRERAARGARPLFEGV